MRLLAFNVNKLEQMLAIMAAADVTGRPAILQASRGARAFANDVVLSYLIRAATPLWKVFAETPGGFDPRKHLAPSVDVISAVCKDWFKGFGAAGMAGKIVLVPHSQMANRYVPAKMARAT